MEIPVIITVLLTMASPFLNAAIQKVTWSSKTKTLVAYGVSIAIAVLYIFSTGGMLGWEQIVAAVPAIYMLQQGIYTFFLKNMTTKFEVLTTPGSVVVSESEESGKVDVTSDLTIKETGDKETVDAPAEIVPVVEIKKDPNVAG